MSGFIKTQKAGSWDCVVFLQQLVDISWFGGEKGSCVPLAAVFYKWHVDEVLGLTHSSFCLFLQFYNFCQILKNNFHHDFHIICIRISGSLLSELFCHFCPRDGKGNSLAKNPPEW